MEALALTILSVFALLGAMSTIKYFFFMDKSKGKNSGIKLILYIPQNSESKLEGVIRQIFLEEIPEKLKTDGKLYLMATGDNEDFSHILEDIKKIYPVEVLPDPISYCMITEREKEQLTPVQVK